MGTPLSVPKQGRQRYKEGGHRSKTSSNSSERDLTSIQEDFSTVAHRVQNSLRHKPSAIHNQQDHIFDGSSTRSSTLASPHRKVQYVPRSHSRPTMSETISERKSMKSSNGQRESIFDIISQTNLNDCIQRLPQNPHHPYHRTCSHDNLMKYLGTIEGSIPLGKEFMLQVNHYQRLHTDFTQYKVDYFLIGFLIESKGGFCPYALMIPYERQRKLKGTWPPLHLVFTPWRHVEGTLNDVRQVHQGTYQHNEYIITTPLEDFRDFYFAWQFHQEDLFGGHRCRPHDRPSTPILEITTMDGEPVDLSCLTDDTVEQVDTVIFNAEAAATNTGTLDRLAQAQAGHVEHMRTSSLLKESLEESEIPQAQSGEVKTYFNEQSTQEQAHYIDRAKLSNPPEKDLKQVKARQTHTSGVVDNRSNEHAYQCQAENLEPTRLSGLPKESLMEEAHKHPIEGDATAQEEHTEHTDPGELLGESVQEPEIPQARASEEGNGNLADSVTQIQVDNAEQADLISLPEENIDNLKLRRTQNAESDGSNDEDEEDDNDLFHLNAS